VTLNVAVPPDSVVINPDAGLTVIPAGVADGVGVGVIGVGLAVIGVGGVGVGVGEVSLSVMATLTGEIVMLLYLTSLLVEVCPIAPVCAPSTAASSVAVTVTGFATFELVASKVIAAIALI
jgi:hypothetical protein